MTDGESLRERLLGLSKAGKKKSGGVTRLSYTVQYPTWQEIWLKRRSRSSQ